MLFGLIRPTSLAIPFDIWNTGLRTMPDLESKFSEALPKAYHRAKTEAKHRANTYA